MPYIFKIDDSEIIIRSRIGLALATNYKNHFFNEKERLQSEIDQIKNMDTEDCLHRSLMLDDIGRSMIASELGDEVDVLHEVFKEFKNQVNFARPDISFSFELVGKKSYQATWTFPNAVYGGSAMWVHGTKKLSWGIASVDMDAWIAFEESNGREPRYT